MSIFIWSSLGFLALISILQLNFMLPKWEHIRLPRWNHNCLIYKVLFLTLSSKSQSFPGLTSSAYHCLSLCRLLLFPVCSHQCDSVIAITANYWCQKWDRGCLHAWNLSDSTIRPQTPATVGGKKKKYMSAKDINGSHIFTPTCFRLNSFTQGGKVLHAPTLP